VANTSASERVFIGSSLIATDRQQSKQNPAVSLTVGY
jgi:hypothetical protein